MSDKTTLVMPGVKKMIVPKVFKRSLQIALAMAATALVVLAVLVANAMLVGKGTSVQGFNIWLAFIRRPDILAIMTLTSIVSVLLIYWQRDQERR